MDAVSYIRERARMCEAIKRCAECPIHGLGCGSILKVSPEMILELVEQWSIEHPFETNGMRFLDQRSNCQHLLDHQKSKRVPLYFYTKATDCVYHNKLWKILYFLFISIPKQLIVCITINCGKFLKRWEYQTT